MIATPAAARSKHAGAATACLPGWRRDIVMDGNASKKLIDQVFDKANQGR